MSWRKVFSGIKKIYGGITVEPLFFLYVLNYTTYYTIFQNLQIEKACRINLNQTESVCDNLEDPANSAVQDDVQKLVANIKMWGSFLSTVPAFLCVSFLGPISDQVRSPVTVTAVFRLELHDQVGQILYPYKDETRDIRSNITLCQKAFPRAKPEGTLEGKGLYLIIYPESSLNTAIISFYQSLG